MMNNLNKLCVVVVGAHNLLPKDEQGSCSAFMELNLDGLRLRTTIKEKDRNPVWNESFSFNISDCSEDYKHLTLDAYVYHCVKPTSFSPRSFFGKISLTGDSFGPYSPDSVAFHYPLQKRGIFSRVRGYLGLKVYVRDPSTPIAAAAHAWPMTQGVPTPDANTTPNAEVELSTHTSHRFPNSSHDHQQQQQEQQQQQQQQQQRPPSADQPVGADEFAIKETSPYLGGVKVVNGRFVHGHKTASTYNLVEQMIFLYVRVVKARNLPARGTTGSINPFVEIEIGNFKGTTKFFVEQKNPVWNQVFAFTSDNLQSIMLDIVIKDKDSTENDDFVGSVSFDLKTIPKRVPPDTPLDPVWYGLYEKFGKKKIKGELMLAVWLGTQADEALSEAYRFDTAALNSAVDHTTLRSKVYQAPRLWYMRVNVIEANDLFKADKNRFPDAYVKLEFGNQVFKTKKVQDLTLNPVWEEDFLFVTAEPFEDCLVLSVEDYVGPNEDEIIVLGTVEIPLSNVDKRVDDHTISTRWYLLKKPPVADEDDNHDRQLKKERFSSRIHCLIILEGGYHVFDESIYYSSDLRPAAEQLWRPPIGIFELGILGAMELNPTKTRDGKDASDTYCVAKYGGKWVRTRTIIGNLSPRFNEPCNWEVFDPATVLTVSVFDNSELLGDEDLSNISDNGNEHLKIGKIRVRISTLQAGRTYTNSFPLLTLHQKGVKKTGELHLAIRFSCTSFVSRFRIYLQPLMPKMHYVRPIADEELDMLRDHAVNIVIALLDRADPPLRKEVVEYMYDVDSHRWSMRRSKSNLFRIMFALPGLFALGNWFSDIRMWKNPILTLLVHVLFLMLVCFPHLIFPTAFLIMFLTGLWNFRFRPCYPPHMDPMISCADGSLHPDELDEEFDTFPTSTSQDLVRMRYDRLRCITARIQTLVGIVAIQGERINALLSWRDPQATALFVTFCLVAALVLYVTPFQVMAASSGLFIMMHPRFRHSMPSGAINFFIRFPALIDSIL